MSKPAAVRNDNKPIRVIVDKGVYEPARIEVSVNTPVELHFLRKDPGPCAEYVQFDALGISEQLPLNLEKIIRLNPGKAGEYDFTCQMKMYRGTLVVK